MSKSVTIFQTMDKDPFVVVDRLVLKAHVPYSDSSLTLLISPNTDINPSDIHKGPGVSDVLLSTPNADGEMKKVFLDLNSEAEKEITEDGQCYLVRLESGQKLTTGGFSWELEVTKVE